MKLRTERDTQVRETFENGNLKFKLIKKRMTRENNTQHNRETRRGLEHEKMCPKAKLHILTQAGKF